MPLLGLAGASKDGSLFRTAVLPLWMLAAAVLLWYHGGSAGQDCPRALECTWLAPMGAVPETGVGLG